MQWLTTWGHDANLELRELLGLPVLHVAGTHHDEPEGGAAELEDADAHAATTPSAPDEATGRWWKHDVVRRLLGEQPGRRLIWVDDELHQPSGFTRWATANAVVTVGPDARTGLTPSDLASIEAAIR